MFVDRRHNFTFIFVYSFILVNIFLIIYLYFKTPQLDNLNNLYEICKEEIKRIYGNEQFISMNLNNSNENCGSIGDMMWRTASMHIIGKLLNRTVYYESIYKCFTEYRQEFEITFKNGGQIIKLMNPKQKYIKKISFGIGCCDFDSPYRLEGENAQIIQVTGSEFKSFKYFEDSREEIHKMFEFNEDIKLAADEAAEGIFRNYTPEHRLCLHTHRHEYIEAGQASTLEFIEGSIKFVMNRLQSNNLKNIAIIFFGNDKNFLYEIEPEEVGA
uniref:Uncharacterized protein n=1 Tax=Meloidogyne floridensis TaxID=298350 RepID=A0A915NEI4_9BILA